MENQEIEVKFHVKDLAGLERRLQELGARLAAPRVYETNLRFDRPDGSLASSFQVLRLRQDAAARLTYKGPSQYQDGARVRTEIEFEVGDFDKAKALFEALGYQVALMYEKHRTTYVLDEVDVVLDEMPYGAFAELEGPDPARLQSLATRLGLDWERRAPDSYTAIFERLRGVYNFTFRDLSFENFQGKEYPLAAIGIRPAD